MPASEVWIEGESQTIQDVRLGEESQHYIYESQEKSKTIGYVETYVETKSVAKTAAIHGVTCDTVCMHLKRERDRRSLADIRNLYAQKIAEDKNDLSSASLLNLIERQGYRCALTGLALTPDLASLDHIVPVSEGGSSEIENLQWVHRDVNTMKGQLSKERFLELCKMVTEFDRHGTPGYLGPH